MRFLGLGKNRTPEYYNEVKRKELDQKYKTGRNRYISWKYIGIVLGSLAGLAAILVILILLL